MRIIALDTATKTGFAIYSEKELTESGVHDFTKKRGESNGLLFIKFRLFVKNLISVVKPDVVIYEQAHHRGGAATELCVNLTGRVQEVCEEMGVEYMVCRTTVLKKHATGKGNAGKDEMVKAAAHLRRTGALYAPQQELLSFSFAHCRNPFEGRWWDT